MSQHNRYSPATPGCYWCRLTIRNQCPDHVFDVSLEFLTAQTGGLVLALQLQLVLELFLMS